MSCRHLGGWRTGVRLFITLPPKCAVLVIFFYFASGNISQRQFTAVVQTQARVPVCESWLSLQPCRGLFPGSSVQAGVVVFSTSHSRICREANFLCTPLVRKADIILWENSGDWVHEITQANSPGVHPMTSEEKFQAHI